MVFEDLAHRRHVANAPTRWRYPPKRHARPRDVGPYLAKHHADLNQDGPLARRDDRHLH